MTQNPRVVLLCVILLSGGISPAVEALAQESVSPPAPGLASDAGVPSPDALDFSLLLPVDLGIPDVNGLTDRFGMPLMGEVVKGSRAVETHTPAMAETPGGSTARKSAVSRIKPSGKRVATKTKDARRTSTDARSSSDSAPRYYVPHGSLDWTPGDAGISTSPASPFGYGHGVSGYGTEVFGDFWKGWPIVE